MQRPGNIRGIPGMTSRHQTTRARSGFIGNFGTFGKGYMAPPPGPPNTPLPGTSPAKYVGDKWVCDGDPPAQEADGYYHCCPRGWTKTKFEVSRPCGEDYGKTVCGPLPAGASSEDGVCCENIQEWMPVTNDGSDPCNPAPIVTNTSNANDAYMYPINTALAPELELSSSPLISPTVMKIGGLAVAALFAVTIIIKLRG